VIRDNKFVFSTDEQQHWYDCPYQVGTNSVDTPLQHATSHILKVLPSDVIVVASDGLSDNLWDQEILVEVAGLDGKNQSVQDIADALCKRARAVGEDQWGESPFMVPSLL
jgi:serine/threonine protein phosphatase PrpC